MVRVEGVRDGLDAAVSGDKQALSAVFAANGCQRIGRLRLVLDTVQVEVYRTDPRWSHLQNAADTIESVLREVGTFREWRPPEEADDSMSPEAYESLRKRQMVRELKAAQGGGSQDADEERRLEEEARRRSQAAAAQDAAARASEEQERAAEQARRRAAAAAGLAAAASRTPGSTPADVNPLAPAPAGPLMPSVPAPAPVAPAAPAREGPSGSVPNSFDEPSRGSMPRRTVGGERHEASEGPLAELSAANAAKDGTCSGWVWKQSRFLKQWRRRWLVLTPQGLATYATPDDPKPTETVSAKDYREVRGGTSDGATAGKDLTLITVHRRYEMVCDQASQREEWVRQIPATLGPAAK